MAETYKTISIISFSLSGVLLVLAMFFWFRYKIPKVIGDLSGKTAQKAIAQIRTSAERPDGESSVSPVARGNFYKTPRNLSGGLIENKPKKSFTDATDRHFESDRLFETKDRYDLNGRIGYTMPIASQANSQTVVLTSAQPPDQNGMDHYTGSERTEVLINKSFRLNESSDQTELLAGFSPATMLLNGGEQAAAASDSTQLLGTTMLPENRPPQPIKAMFTVVETIVMVHTEEVIS